MPFRAGETRMTLMCEICEEAKAVKLNDGDRVCAACDVIMDNIVTQHPELAERDPCIGCGAMQCEDALCHAS
jgi:hypothetical protein